MKIEITQEQLNNLLIFLNRVNLQGNEAGALIDIIGTLQRANQIPPQIIPVDKPSKHSKDSNNHSNNHSEQGRTK